MNDSVDGIDTGDPMMDRIMRTILDRSAGRRERFQTMWDAIGEDGDPLYRCTLAHYAADEESEPELSLLWNQRSLDAASTLEEERLQAVFADLSVAGFRPSLHINLAQDFVDLGRTQEAAAQLDSAAATLDALPQDGYADMIRRGIARLRERLADG